MTLAGLDLYVPAVTPHDPVANGQTQPRAPRILGGKKRVEDTLQIVWRDPDTVIRHANDHAIVSPRLRGYLHTTAVANGTHCINEQIDHHLLQLEAVYGDGARIIVTRLDVRRFALELVLYE